MKKNQTFFLFFFFLLSYCLVEGCTSFKVKTTDGAVFYARTLEGEEDLGSNISIIPKGTSFAGSLPDGSHNGLKWISKYGVVGMNAFGLPVLSDGLNEKGLSAGNLLFPGFSHYQDYDSLQKDKTLAQWELITWILTNFSTVNEVKKAIHEICVTRVDANPVGLVELHFTVHDATGDSAVIEYVQEGLKIYDNPIGVMTNSPPFDWHLINLRNYVNISAVNVKPLEINGMKETGLGQGTGMLGLPGDYTPPSRFIRMVALVLSSLPVTGLDEGLNLAMTIMDNVDIPKGAVRDKSGKKVAYDRTFWTTISDLASKKFYFRTYKNKDWRFVDLTKALVNAKKMKTIQVDTPPSYKDVTETSL